MLQIVAAAAIASSGLVPGVPGTHGAKVDLPDLNKMFVPKEDGGILSRRGCVDFSTGKVAPGVFAPASSHACAHEPSRYGRYGFLGSESLFSCAPESTG